MEEDPNLEFQKFYDLLQAADTELYSDFFTSQLEVMSRMLNIKMKNTLSWRGHNKMKKLLKEVFSKDKIVLDSYY